jgi:hypothetical protein
MRVIAATTARPRKTPNNSNPRRHRLISLPPADCAASEGELALARA